MGDPHGDLQTTTFDPHGLGALRKTIQEIYVDRRVVGWSAGRQIAHVGGKFRHGLLEKSLV